MEPDKHAKHRDQPCCAEPALGRPNSRPWRRWKAAAGWAPIDGGVRGAVERVETSRSLLSASGHDVVVVAGLAADGTETREVVVLPVRRTIRRGIFSSVWFEVYVGSVFSPLPFVVAMYLYGLVAVSLGIVIGGGYGNWPYGLLFVGSTWMLLHHVASSALVAIRSLWIPWTSWIPWGSASVGCRLRRVEDRVLIDDDGGALERLCRALDDPDGAREVRALLSADGDRANGRRARAGLERLFRAVWSALPVLMAGTGLVVGADLDLDRHGLAIRLVAFIVVFSMFFGVLSTPYLLGIRLVRMRDRWNDPAFPSAPEEEPAPATVALETSRGGGLRRTWLGRILPRR